MHGRSLKPATPEGHQSAELLGRLGRLGCQHAELDMAAVVGHLQQLGLSLNSEKSQLTPSQQIHFLGVKLDSVAM